MRALQLKQLHPTFDALQKRHGGAGLRAVYGGGCVRKPDICFVFMNPTARNVSAHPGWGGVRAPWLGTKHAWKLFARIGVFDAGLANEIQATSANGWTPTFAERVYREVARRKVFITNFSKATQADARPLSNAVFEDYRELLEEELRLLAPKVVVSFGIQVSSLLLRQKVEVSKCRKTVVPLSLGEKTYPVCPVHYPVGQGMRNIDTAVADVQWVVKKCV